MKPQHVVLLAGIAWLAVGGLCAQSLSTVQFAAPRYAVNENGGRVAGGRVGLGW